MGKTCVQTDMKLIYILGKTCCGNWWIRLGKVLFLHGT